MQFLRRHLRRHRAAALALVVLALLVRLAVPAGFMPVAHGGTITVALCTGSGPQTIEIAVPGGGSDEHRGKPAHKGAADAPCAFAGLAHPAIGGADPLVLATAIAFVLASGLRRVPPLPVRASVRLRPPPIGPPVRA